MIADLSLRRVHSTLGTAVALVLGLTFVLLLSTPARAGPGDLDPTFGGDGKVMTPLGQQAICALATAVLPDGRILVVGQSEFPSMDFTWGLVLARYNANGSLDRSFGDNGLVHLEFGADSVSGKAIAVQPDGKVVVAGESGGYESRDFFLARFNSSGSLDTTFGTDGMVRTDITGSGDTGQALAIQTNGRIIVVGSTETAESANDLAVVRYHPNGSLDTNFDGDGKVVLNLGSPEDYGSDIAIQPDGKIVVSGVAGNELALARLLPDGSLDNGFAHQGIFTHDLGFSGNTLQIQADSKIVVVGDGYTSYTGSIIGLARLSSGGSLDRTFGNQGVVITSFTPGTNSYDDFGTDVIIETNGRIIVAGSAETATDKDFALARYLPDGRLDSSFGNGGLVTTDFAGRFDASYSLALQLDGKIIGVGNTEAYGNWPLLNSDFALARYHPNGSLDVGFGVAGRVTSNFELGQSLARSVAVQADNKIVVAGSAYEGGQTGWDFALVRYNLDGSLDSAFGTDGIVLQRKVER